MSGEFSASGVKPFLVFLCLVRRQLNKSKEELTVVIQDDDGVIDAASLWVVLYGLLQQIDEVVPSNNNKTTTSSNKDFGKLDVFRAVNDPRKQRSKVISPLQLTNSFLRYCNVMLNTNQRPRKFDRKTRY